MKIFEKVVTKLSDAKQKFSNSWLGTWLSMETRWAWLVLAFVLGFFSDSFYCASLVGGTAIIAYFASIHKEWKLKGSYLIAALILALAFAGYGLVELLTEK